MSTLTNRTNVGGPMGGATGGNASGGGGGGASTDDSSDSNVLSQYKVLTLTFNQDCTYVFTLNSHLIPIVSLSL